MVETAGTAAWEAVGVGTPADDGVWDERKNGRMSIRNALHRLTSFATDGFGVCVEELTTNQLELVTAMPILRLVVFRTDGRERKSEVLNLCMNGCFWQVSWSFNWSDDAAAFYTFSSLIG